jgi:flavorubredoxin
VEAPIRFMDTDEIAPNTFVIRQIIGEGVAPMAVHLNSMVITGEEPVIVDTGVALTRDEWMRRVFGLVDPEAVRWVFLSHDDHDHVGNLLQVLDLCPNATLVTNWFSVERLAGDYALPLDRMTWINDGESFKAGRRVLAAVVPPTFDSPTTRGLYDVTTGVYWASDSFAVAVPYAVDDVDDLDPELLRESFLTTQSMVSPWVQWVDQAKYDAHIDRIAALGALTVAGAHAVTLRGAQVGRSIELLRELPSRPPVTWPGQAELELTLAQLASTAAA